MGVDREVLVVAKSYLARYGHAAEMRARRRAAVLEAEGQLDGRDSWLKVARTIERLLALERSNDEVG
jgi:hypothetical protein